MLEICQVGLLDIIQVVRADLLLIVTAAFADVGQQLLDGSIEIQRQIRLRQIRIDDVKQRPVELGLLLFQVIHRKDIGLLKEKVRHREGLEHILLAQHRLQLLKTICHEVQLHRKSMPLRIRVESRQKGIILKLLQYQAAIQVLRYLACQGRLPGAYASFYGYKRVIQCFF